MDESKIKIAVQGLRNDTIRSNPVEIDWSQALGEDCEGWVSYDQQECTCGEVLVGTPGEQRHCDIDEESDCMEALHFYEPMMSYYYPIPHATFDADDAKKISGPLVLVEFENGEWALALAGGGMDYSWEICRAFVELGYLPPSCFRLPDMAGMVWNEETALVVYALRRSLDAASRWIDNDRRDLEHIEGILKENSNKEK